jgi:hypothetical protein
MPSSLTLTSFVWRAEPLPDPPLSDNRLSPLAVDKHWQALGQSWRGGESEPGFNPGWARIQWSKSKLHYDAILLGIKPTNRAIRLNQRTWELGDVFEIFLQVGGEPRYVELHVTPENRRLQLLWPVGGLERLRQDAAGLEEFMVPSADWVQSSTHIGPGFWVVHVSIPFSVLGLDPNAPIPPLRTAVCRYDYGTLEKPVLSSTAPLQAADYHRLNDWQTLELSANRT